MKKWATLGLILVCVSGFVGCFKTQKCDLIPMVMVDGVMYLHTGYYNTDIHECGIYDGEITSEVDGSERPNVDNQSNFGKGYGYQIGMTEGTIEIYMNDKWYIFATEEARKQINEQRMGLQKEEERK